jgi:hypothetical protein
MTKIKWTTTFFKLTFIFPHLTLEKTTAKLYCVMLYEYNSP